MLTFKQRARRFAPRSASPAVGAPVGASVDALVGASVGALVGASVGASVGALVGASVTLNPQTPVSQFSLPQSPLTAQTSPVAHPGQESPPQSTSVSSPFFTLSVQDDAVGACVGAIVGEEVVGDVVGDDAQALPTQLSLSQSPSTPQTSPAAQVVHSVPPQSTSVSPFPASNTPFLHRLMVGAFVGDAVGLNVGETVGFDVGEVVGDVVGAAVPLVNIILVLIPKSAMSGLLVITMVGSRR